MSKKQNKVYALSELDKLIAENNKPENLKRILEKRNRKNPYDKLQYPLTEDDMFKTEDIGEDYLPEITKSIPVIKKYKSAPKKTTKKK